MRIETAYKYGVSSSSTRSMEACASTSNTAFGRSAGQFSETLPPDLRRIPEHRAAEARGVAAAFIHRAGQIHLYGGDRLLRKCSFEPRERIVFDLMLADGNRTDLPSI